MAALGKLPYTLQSPFVDALKMINILQICNLIDKRHQSRFSYDRLTGAGVRYYSLNVIPLSIRLILQKFGDYRQSLYNSAVLYALERKLLSQIVTNVHTLLIAFRYF
jgi:hypothetical protein